ncbi:MAG: hypothetical protein IE932_12075 [Sphingopyxis terrae]|nr:hypothetical protein [Sphingopyxis terrae]
MISDVNFDRISASLGSFLLVWASVERSVRKQVIRVRGVAPHGMGAVLARWEETVIELQPATSLCPLLASTLRHQIEGPLRMRNGICHGLEGISAASGDEPAMLHWELNGQKHAVTWEDLQATLRWLSELPRAFSVIAQPLLEKPGSRGIDTAENREWWRTEFGLSV